MAAEPVESPPVAGRRVLRGFVADVVGLPTGPELVAGLVGLMGGDLSAREWVEVTVAWKRMIGFCTAGAADRGR